ncbi:uncharacterized protein LOC108095942 [Drosophila ficusphila]|uniref:uncharacterized protein LOC108095942 n=1 Tax=Drosophila ficusphila TaxID=30025 RepID=UPI0007E63F48|nr:uncharacterized protein LOC108095942 [Drosophila ficusphila]
MELEMVESLKIMHNCAKLHLDQIDPITRTLKCRSLEIFDVDEDVSFSDVEEEEQMELSVYEDEPDSQDRALLAVHDIDCLIRQIELMQLAIRNRQVKESSEKISEEPVEQSFEIKTKAQIQCLDLENLETALEVRVNPTTKQPKFPPLTCDDLLEARSLVKAHNCIQQEIDHIVCRYQQLRKISRQMRRNLHCMGLELKDLSSKVQGHLEWIREVGKELNVCKERYDYLMKAKVSKLEARKTCKVHAERLTRFNAAYLTKSKLRREIIEFSEEVNDLVLLMGELHQELHRSMALFETQRTNEQENPTEFLISTAVAGSLSDMFRESAEKLKPSDKIQK